MKSFGFELNVPQAMNPINPNDPIANMTAFCMHCQDEGIVLPASVDPGRRTCPYIREGSWMWLGMLWDPEGTLSCGTQKGADTLGRQNKQKGNSAKQNQSGRTANPHCGNDQDLYVQRWALAKCWLAAYIVVSCCLLKYLAFQFP